ncbi:MAG TPA: septation protein A [Alphaproteobacteria bacterium]|nr:septation protein A [Alphaproteobacteria bacterium]
MNPILKLTLDLGPLLIFFGTYSRAGIMVGTAAFMVATVAALVTGYALTRRIAILPLATTVVVLVFGGLTLIFANDVFIKLKPTIIYGLFAAVLFGGLIFGRPLLKPLMGMMIALDEAAWRILTLRWGWYFVLCAILNEMIWRNFSTDVWVDFKVFGFTGLTIVFALAQVPYMQRHKLADPA